jgi:PhnB protein
MTLKPYVFFYGRCEEALNFYKTALGGTFEIMLNRDSPMADNVPADFADKVMHAKFTADGLEFMAADGLAAKAIDPEAGNISLALSAADATSAQRIFDALSHGGTVKMPFDDAFWGGRFGMCNDQFGIEWMVSSQ